MRDSTSSGLAPGPGLGPGRRLRWLGPAPVLGQGTWIALTFDPNMMGIVLDCLSLSPSLPLHREQLKLELNQAGQLCDTCTNLTMHCVLGMD